MASIQLVIDRVVDLAVGTVPWAGPAGTLGVLSALLGLLMLLVFRQTSDQARIRRTKNQVKAHLLELWLFRHDLRTTLRAQARLLGLNGRYLGLAVKPMLVMAVPVALVLISLEGRFGYRPLRPDEAAIVSVRLADGGVMLAAEDVTLEVDGALAVDTPPLRIRATREINWRIRSLQPGVHRFTIALPSGHLEKRVVVAGGPGRVSPVRLSTGWWQALVNPGEPPIPRETGIERIELRYPTEPVRVLGWELPWLGYVVIVSILTAIGLRRPLRVEL